MNFVAAFPVNDSFIRVRAMLCISARQPKVRTQHEAAAQGWHSSFPPTFDMMWAFESIAPLLVFVALIGFLKRARRRAPPHVEVQNDSHEHAHPATPSESPEIITRMSPADDSTAPSAIVPANQSAIAQISNATPNADIPAPETESSPRPAHIPNSAATCSQPDVKTQGEERQAVEAEELKEKLENAITVGQLLFSDFDLAR